MRTSGLATIHRKRIGGEVWHVLDGVPLPISITPAQISALRLARMSLSALADTALLKELDALIGDATQPHPRIAIVSRHRPSNSALSTIEAALDRGRRLSIEATIASRGGASQRYTVDPLALRLVHGDAYLHAWAVERGSVRTFKVDRIRSAAFTGEHVEEHADVDVDALFESAVKTWSGDRIVVRIRIVASAAWAVREYPIVDNQHVVREPDGSAIVEAEVAGLVEVTRWVLRWGKHAEALSPPALREAVRSELEGALASYDAHPSDRVRSNNVSDPEVPPPPAMTTARTRSTTRTTQVRGRK